MLLLIAVNVGVFFTSYSCAKGKAEVVAQSCYYSISPLKAHLALFGNSELTPCWLFSAEYDQKGILSGSTFDVYVSFTGNKWSVLIGQIF